MITQALIFAAAAHEGQKRKGTEIPYILHPAEAGAIAARIKFDEELIAAAILHDTMEDCRIGSEALEKVFGKRVADLVSAMSEDKSKSWEERKQHTIGQLKNEKDEDVLILALADKLSNIRQIYADQKIMGDRLWERFNAGKDDQRRYYTGLLEGLKALDHLPEYKEYEDLVQKVFGH